MPPSPRASHKQEQLSVEVLSDVAGSETSSTEGCRPRPVQGVYGYVRHRRLHPFTSDQVTRFHGKCAYIYAVFPGCNSYVSVCNAVKVLHRIANSLASKV